MRKLVLPVFALAVFMFAGSAAFTADDKAKGESHDHHAAYDTCAKACGDCQRACDSCATHCANLIAQGKKEHMKTLQTCQDCATHCSAAASIVARMGPFSDTICTACAEACSRCGMACEKFSDDRHMKKCADECKNCETACKAMLKHLPTK
jgi:hypothetical protein